MYATLWLDAKPQVIFTINGQATMSILAPIEDVIHKLDPQAAAELAAVKADAEAKLGQVMPIVHNLRGSLQTAVADAAEAAAPGLRAALDAAVTAAEQQLVKALGL